MAKADLYITLVHYPVLNKHGELVTTSVTNFDLHDLARTGRTFGVKKVFILTPSVEQRGMVDFIYRYWREGKGAAYNPDRREAWEILQATENLEQTCLTIKTLSGRDPYLIATTAQPQRQALSFAEVKQKLADSNRPLLLAFGTGHGLAREFFDRCDAVLEPITGQGDYNHLPVRAAVAIILDRLQR